MITGNSCHIIVIVMSTLVNVSLILYLCFVAFAFATTCWWIKIYINNYLQWQPSPAGKFGGGDAVSFPSEVRGGAKAFWCISGVRKCVWYSNHLGSFHGNQNIHLKSLKQNERQFRLQYVRRFTDTAGVTCDTGLRVRRDVNGWLIHGIVYLTGLFLLIPLTHLKL